MKQLSLLLASDGSEGSLNAARWIMEHFQPDDVHVTVATVSRTPMVMGSPTFATLPAYSESMEDVAVQEAHEACQKTQQVLQGFNAQGAVIGGRSIAETLISYIASHSQDAIVVGRRSHSLSRHLLGSISTELVTHSPVPVWVIP